MNKKVSSLVIVAPHSKEDVTKLVTKLNENGYKLQDGSSKEDLYRGTIKKEHPLFIKIYTDSKKYEPTNYIIFTGIICCSENIRPILFEDAWKYFDNLFIKKDPAFYFNLIAKIGKDPKYPKIELQVEKRKMKV